MQTDWLSQVRLPINGPLVKRGGVEINEGVNMLGGGQLGQVRLAINALLVKKGELVGINEGETCHVHSNRQGETCYGEVGLVRFS